MQLSPIVTSDKYQSETLFLSYLFILLLSTLLFSLYPSPPLSLSLYPFLTSLFIFLWYNLFLFLVSRISAPLEIKYFTSSILSLFTARCRHVIQLYEVSGERERRGREERERERGREGERREKRERREREEKRERREEFNSSTF
jgi:hypothetical protein